MHLKFFHWSLDRSSKICFLHPARYLLDERGTNKEYNKILDRIDGHVYKAVIDRPEKMFPQGCSLRGANICYVLVDQTKTFDSIEVVHRNMNKTVTVNSLRDIDEHGNHPHYLSFKKKVLDYCKKKNLRDAFSKTNKGTYGINIGDLASYEFFGKKNKSGRERAVWLNVNEGVHGEDEKLANAWFDYFRNPIAVLALHIYKKDYHVWVSMDSVPWFDTEEEFKSPEIPLTLNKNEVDYAIRMNYEHPTWRKIVTF
jgi:hypothetical protein